MLFFQVELHDSTYENVLVFLEYLYTDRCPFQDGDPAGFLILSYQYLMPRIKSVCEHYLAEAVEKAQVTNVIGKYWRTSLMHHLLGRFFQYVLPELGLFFTMVGSVIYFHYRQS